MRTLVVMVLVVALGSGCSLIKAQAPMPNYRPPEDPKCLTTRAYPATDVVFAGLLALGAIGVLGAASQGTSSSSGGTIGTGVASIGLAGLFGFSAYRGFSAASECEAALASRDDFLAKQAAAEREVREAEQAAQRAEAELRQRQAAERLEALKKIETAPALVRVTNQLPEVLVSLALHFPETGETSNVAVKRRVTTGDTFEATVTGRQGQTFEVVGWVVAMGREHPLMPVRLNFAGSGTLDVSLDYDMALAQHRLRAAWRGVQPAPAP